MYNKTMEAGALPYLTERYPLLVTKLYIPKLAAELHARTGLMERLNQAIQGPVVLVTAPAGWGKTTLVACWAQQARHSIGWVSLDAGDNDLARFWLHLIAALGQFRRGMGEVALSWFYAREAPPIEARLTVFLNDLALADETFILVMDDCHYIHNPAIHDSLAFFIENLPPNIHLILTSRSNLPLPQARWRASRQLVEFDSQDLRFSPEECTQFFHKGMGLDLTPDQITALIDRTEGWVAGLQLAALALQRMLLQQDRADVDGFITGLGGINRYIFDYLSEEVLFRQDPEIQAFLLQTSVLERMSCDLCESITGIRESQRILESLEEHKLFIVSLDDEQRWFRYHHLFRDFLSSQLTRARPNMVADLHRSAAQWYAARGLPHDAVPHAMSAQDYDLAGRIVMQYANELWQREEEVTLRNWLAALPRDLRESHPDLCLFHAWSLLLTSELNGIFSLLARAEVLLDAEARPLGDFSTGELRGILAIICGGVGLLQQDYKAASAFAQSALAQLPLEHKAWRYVALVGVGMAHQIQNETDAALQTFEDAIAEVAALKRSIGSSYRRTFAMSWLARLHVVKGHLQRAREINQEALTLATGQNGSPLPSAAWALAGLGELYYQWNDLERAKTYFHESLELSTLITPTTVPPYFPLARLAYAQGDVRSAQAYLAQAVRLVESAHLPHYSEQIGLYRAWLALQQGDLTALGSWVLDQNLDLAQPIPQREAAYVMAARILIALQDYPAALGLIEKLLALAEVSGRGGVVIELLILQALALQGQDRPDPALSALQRAIELAERESYVRIFVDEGESMLQLLWLLLARFGATDYSARLVSIFASEQKRRAVLNDRELGVLRLMANGMSNREISEALFITMGTVKWYTNHIYRKLGVKNRGQAVAKARELRLLSNSTP